MDEHRPPVRASSDLPPPPPPPPPKGNRALVVVLAITLVVALGLFAAIARSVTEDPNLEGGEPPRPETGETPGRSDGGDDSRAAPTVYDTSTQACVTKDLVAHRPPRGDSRTQLDRIATIVEGIRDLEFERPPTTTFQTRREFGNRLRKQVTDSYPKERQRVDQKVLMALGIIEEPIDLKELAADIAGTQIAGVYSPRTKKLFVGSKQIGSAYAQVTLAHELEHALVDQRLGIPRLTLSARKGDVALARRAFVEGDATILTQKYVAGVLDAAARADLLADPAIAEATEQGEEIPYFVEQSLMFPYTEGALFTCRLYLKGGWDAVDRAYKRPPTSTAEIIFPGRYRKTDHKEPPGPHLDPERWPEHEVQSFGAAELMWLVQAPNGEPLTGAATASQWVRGWNGGRIDIWTSGRRVALALSFREKRVAGSDDLCVVMERWYRTAFPNATESRSNGATKSFESGSEFVTLTCRADLVWLAIAPDPPTARALAR